MLLALFSLAVEAQAPSKPRIPFYDWGACPFEGCTYRKWKAEHPVTVWTDRSRKHVAFKVQAGEWVTGITGVVITTRFGISRVLVPMMLDEEHGVQASPGDILYTLHYLGEGYDLFWFKGHTHSDQIAGDEKIHFVSRPQCSWWAKVRNSKKLTGWTDQTDRFSNMDQFASVL